MDIHNQGQNLEFVMGGHNMKKKKGNSRIRNILKFKIKLLCDCVALARKLNCIFELNTTNRIPKRSITSSFCTFFHQCFFLMQKDKKKQQRDKMVKSLCEHVQST